ncbi:MAG: DUF4428 domain-containing protein [Ruminococcus sp.]
MGLFDKKFCDVCGEKIGLLGNRKLEDGNLCKECAKKLSPFFSERRASTVEEIKQQLDYREENKKQLAFLNPNRVIGSDKKVYIDENAGKFIVTSSLNWRESNPDIINISQVTGCNIEIREDKDEIMQTDNQGNEVSYNPPRYKCEYLFNVEITVNSPWFSVIRFELTKFGQRPDSRFTDLYRDYERQADELRRALMPNGYGQFSQPYQQNNGYQRQQNFNQQPYVQQQGFNQQPYAQQQNFNQQPQQPIQQPVQGTGMWVCTNCGTQNTSRFCQNCGNQQPQANTYQNNARMVRCDKCGWMPSDNSNIPKFCPQCGDVFDFNDMN